MHKNKDHVKKETNRKIQNKQLIGLTTSLTKKKKKQLFLHKTKQKCHTFINEDTLNNPLDVEKQYIDIPNDYLNIIKHCRKSSLEHKIWTKNATPIPTEYQYRPYS